MKQTLRDIERRVVRFRDKRAWKKFHTPIQLALSVQLEASEILELFQWKTSTEFRGWIAKRSNRDKMRDEIADVLIYLVLLAHAVGADLEAAVEKKMRKNARNYPVSFSKGNAIKYTERRHRVETTTSAIRPSPR